MLSDKVFKALAAANRRKIINLLRKKELTAGEIVVQQISLCSFYLWQ